jgi:hypothetical protein
MESKRAVTNFFEREILSDDLVLFFSNLYDGFFTKKVWFSLHIYLAIRILLPKIIPKRYTVKRGNSGHFFNFELEFCEDGWICKPAIWTNLLVATQTFDINFAVKWVITN